MLLYRLYIYIILFSFDFFIDNFLLEVVFSLFSVSCLGSGVFFGQVGPFKSSCVSISAAEH